MGGEEGVHVLPSGLPGDLHMFGGGTLYKGEGGIFWPSLSLIQAA